MLTHLHDSATWFERAIVENSLAIDHLRQMQDSSVRFNDAARTAITLRAYRAEQNLTAARRAYELDRTKAVPSV